jgi:hypothetical protein
MKKTENNSPDTIEVKPHITEVLNDHPVIHWIVENRKNILYVFATLVILTLLLVRFTAGAPGQKEANLIQAETEVVNLQRVILGIDKETNIDEAFKKVNQLLKQYPELNSKYDAPLAQAFLATDKPTDAQSFADQSLKRTKANDLNFYQDFAKTSLLIGEGKYQEALTQAQQLKDTLLKEAPEKDLKFGSALFAYNLIRIATLNQALENKKEELNAWKEWKEYSKTSQNQINSDAFLQITKQLETGHIKLTDYIAQRERG